MIEPLLSTKVRGVARVDDRRVLNGIFGGYGPVRHGRVSRLAMGRIRRASTGSTDGGRLAYGIGFWLRFQKPMMAICR